jgi:Holliday junction resolvase RusA-like endonuclease
VSPLLNAQEIERGLIAMGVPRDRARAEALRQVDSDQSTAVSPLYPARPSVSDLPAIQWPVRLTLPWSSLVSDNERYGVINGKLLLTSAYRRGKGLVRDLARETLGEIALADYPLSLEARVWVPDEFHAHDVCNFAKAVHDALQGVLITNDRWLWDTRWIHAGADIDAPRAEVTITPLPVSP